MTEERDLLERIEGHLEKLVKLEIEDKLEEYDTNKEKVRELHNLGFETQDIAGIIGTSPPSVRAAKSKLRGEGKIDD